jgi:hypothetical protein
LLLIKLAYKYIRVCLRFGFLMYENLVMETKERSNLIIN